jgi:hypothetical protein
MQAYHQYGVGLRGFVDLKKWCTRLAATNLQHININGLLFGG